MTTLCFRTPLLLILAALLPLLGGCLNYGDGSAYDPLPAASDAGALRRGEILTIRLQGVSESDQGDRQVAIANTGSIVLPLIGEVRAEGLQAGPLADNIQRIYRERRIYPNATVSIVPPQRTITVGGKVNNSGVFPWREGITLTDAIQSAGGYDVYGLKDPVIVTRQGRAYKVNGRIAEQGGYNPILYPGDSVHVQTRGIGMTGDISTTVGSIPPPPVDTLRCGDVLNITFANVPKSDAGTYEFKVDERGNIQLPHLGLTPVAGQTPSQAQEAIRVAYVARGLFTNPTVGIIPAQRFVSVGGRVLRPGAIVWSDDLTLTRAIDAASGFHSYAKRDGVILLRDGKRYVVDANEASRGGFNPTLYPGDIITVEATSF